MQEQKRTYVFSRSKELLTVKVEGTNIARNDSHRLSELVDYLEKYSCKKCLYDYSEGNFSIDVWTAYSRPDEADRHNLSRDVKIAAIYREITSDIRFFENVFRNRGFNFKAFTDHESAETWLLSNQSAEAEVT